MKYRSLITILASLIILGGQAAQADDHDIILQRPVDSYTVKIQYPTDFQAGIPSWLNIFLNQTQDLRSVPFSNVDIVISQNSVPYLSMVIAKKVGIATGGVITFPQTGRYLIHLTFYDSKNTIVADTSFTVSVEKPSNQTRILGVPLTRELGIGAVGGVVISALFVQYERIMRRHDPDAQ